MDLKTFFIRLAVLLVVIAGGSFLYVLTFHGLVLAGLMPEKLGQQGFGYALTYRTSFVFMAAILAGIVSLFIRQSWRLVLLLSPLYAPCLFAIVFTLLNKV